MIEFIYITLLGIIVLFLIINYGLKRVKNQMTVRVFLILVLDKGIQGLIFRLKNSGDCFHILGE